MIVYTVKVFLLNWVPDSDHHIVAIDVPHQVLWDCLPRPAMLGYDDQQILLPQPHYLHAVLPEHPPQTDLGARFVPGKVSCLSMITFCDTTCN